MDIERRKRKNPVGGGKESRADGKDLLDRRVTYTGDFGGMVDKVDGGIGGIAESYLLVHEDFVEECVEDLGLLVLGGIGFGGVCGTAEGVVFCWAPVGLARVEGCGEGGDGEGEEGENGRELHFG